MSLHIFIILRRVSKRWYIEIKGEMNCKCTQKKLCNNNKTLKEKIIRLKLAKKNPPNRGSKGR